MNQSIYRKWLMEPSEKSLRELLNKSEGSLTKLVHFYGALVKDGKHRQVWRVIGPGVDVHVKCNPVLGFRSMARRILRGSKAGLEARRIAELSRAGINTLEVLALVEDPGLRGASWIITKSVPHGVPLDSYLLKHGNSLSVDKRVTITKNMADLFFAMHQRGYQHTDLHPGNLLVDPSGKSPMLLLDVHDLARQNPSWHANLANLVVLNRWFADRASPHERGRFLRSYLNNFRIAGSICPWSRGSLARLIEKETLQSKQRLWSNRDGRCVRCNKDFHSFTLIDGPSAGNGFAVTHFPIPALNHLPPSLLPDRGTKDFFPGVQLLKRSKSSAVALVEVIMQPQDGQLGFSGGVVVKDIPPKPWWRRNLSQHSCLRSWVLGHGLRGRFLPTPEPLAVIQRIDGSWRLVQFAVYDSRPLDVWWLSESHFKIRYELARRLGYLLNRLHASGSCHRDLKSANLLVDQHNIVWMVDLVGVTLATPPSISRRQADIARLARSALAVGGVTPGEMLRVLKYYLGGKLNPGWKIITNNILNMAREKIKRNFKRNRPSG